MRTYQRLTLIGLLFIFVALGYGKVEGADWRFLGEDKKDGSIKFFDAESIVRLENDIYGVWVKKTTTEEITLSQGYIEWDCPKRMFRYVIVHHFDESGDISRTLEKDELISNWTPIAPGSYGETIYKQICPQTWFEKIPYVKDIIDYFSSGDSNKRLGSSKEHWVKGEDGVWREEKVINYRMGKDGKLEREGEDGVWRAVEEGKWTVNADIKRPKGVPEGWTLSPRTSGGKRVWISPDGKRALVEE